MQPRISRVLRISAFHARRMLRRFTLSSLRNTLLGITNQGSFLPKSTHITWPHSIQIGKNCIVKEDVILHVDGPYDESIRIKIGNNVFIGNNAEFNITSMVSISDDCQIGSGVKFIDHNHGMRKDLPIRQQACTSKEIKVHSDVWIGSNTIVLEGVKIGQGAIIGANSLVNRDVPEYEVWAGAPVKFIRART